MNIEQLREEVAADEGCVYEETLLIPNDEMTGKWHDILVHVKWSKKDDGFFKMFVNDELKYNYEGRTQSKLRAVMYQFGIYRTGITRYLNYKNLDTIWSCFQEKGYTVEENTALYRLERRKQIRLKESMNLYKKCKEFYDPAIVVPTTIVYYDEVRKGKTKDEVTIGLRGVDVSVEKSVTKQKNSHGGKEDR